MQPARDFTLIEDAITLADAWEELSEGGFAFWLRLQDVSASVLTKGRQHLARELNMTRRTTDRRLRELRNEGYIRLVAQRSGAPTLIILSRRALIVGPTRFLKL